MITKNSTDGTLALMFRHGPAGILLKIAAHFLKIDLTFLNFNVYRKDQYVKTARMRTIQWSPLDIYLFICFLNVKYSKCRFLNNFCRPEGLVILLWKILKCPFENVNLKTFWNIFEILALTFLASPISALYGETLGRAHGD